MTRHCTNTMYTRNCILCDSHRKVTIANRMKPGPQLPTVICLNCSLVYSDPMPDEKEYYSFYSYDYEKYYGKNTAGAPNKAILPEVLEKLLQFIEPSDKTYLEIGPGRGNVLWHASRHFKEAIGIEPSIEFAEYLEKELKLTIKHGFFEEVIQNLDTKFHIVGMYHVLEHFYNPDATILKIKQLLTPDGYMVIEVPNILKPFRSLDRYFLRFVHPFNFSPFTLTKLLKKHGFEIIYIDDAGIDWKQPQNIKLIAKKSANSTIKVDYISANKAEEVIEILTNYRNYYKKKLWFKYSLFIFKRRTIKFLKKVYFF